jgi:hypothetical protein
MDVSLTGTFEEMALGTTVTKPFAFTRTTADGKRTINLVLRVLNPLELDRSRVNAAMYVRNLDPDKLVARSREEWIKEQEDIEILSIACRSAKDPSIPFATSSIFREKITPEEIALITRAYERHAQEISPFVNGMSSDDFFAIVKAVEAQGESSPLEYFDWPTQRAFMLTSASLLGRLLTDSASISLDSLESNKSKSTEQPSETESK